MSGDDDARYPRLSEAPEEASTVFQPRFELGVDAPEPTFHLRVVRGPDAGAERVVGGAGPARIVLGTSPTCELRVSDPQVSRRHAALAVDSGALAITDLESTNGTWLGSVRVREILLTGGETITLGSTMLRVERGASAPASLSSETQFGSTLGGSREMRRLFPLLRRLAAASVPVVIQGETGTGKEVLAESIHAESPRRDGPFVVFDCTAVPANLLESELFGHERGAFTGAVGTRRGVFEQAHGGTLLIDEIGDLDGALQPKLLRAIERSEVRRVGGDRWLKVDVRLVVATRRDLDREVQAGRFRDDLFHRLAVARVELPPLRKRREDIPLLVQRFAAELGADAATIPAPLLAAWREQTWPGNVRELRNQVARHLALGELSALTFSAAGDSEDEPTAAQASAPPPGPSAPTPDAWLEALLAEKLPFVEARERVLTRFERLYIEYMLEASGGNVARAAAHAGVARRYFQILKARRL
jgi:DNA-binding NtrC family response regulator